MAIVAVRYHPIRLFWDVPHHSTGPVSINFNASGGAIHSTFQSVATTDNHRLNNVLNVWRMNRHRNIDRSTTATITTTTTTTIRLLLNEETAGGNRRLKNRFISTDKPIHLESECEFSDGGRKPSIQQTNQPTNQPANHPSNERTTLIKASRFVPIVLTLLSDQHQTVAFSFSCVPVCICVFIYHQSSATTHSITTFFDRSNLTIFTFYFLQKGKLKPEHPQIANNSIDRSVDLGPPLSIAD